MTRYEAVVKDVSQLREIYGEPSPRSLDKVLDHLSDHYCQFVQAAPFVVLASVGPEGLDTSPRGDDPGFVRVLDANTLVLPDRRGNNRADTLMNIVRDPRVSMLFLIPGVGETLRVIGKAEIVVDKALCDSFAVQGKAPRSVLVVHVEQVYFQCQKALARSKLWRADSQVDRATLPSAGQILAGLDEDFDGEAYDRGYPRHMQKTIY
jgi:PPOX class probable FMN-dependent enzyme